MKKLLVVFALLIGPAAASFAQPGADCAWNTYDNPLPKPAQMQLAPLTLFGISDAEGDPVYSVTMKANFTTQSVSNVVVTQIKTGKKWLMNQAQPTTKSIPSVCKAPADPSYYTAYKGVGTNLIIYVTVPDHNASPQVHLYRPAISNVVIKL